MGKGILASLLVAENTHTHMLEYQSTMDLLNKLWFFCYMQYYAAIKRFIYLNITLELYQKIFLFK